MREEQTYPEFHKGMPVYAAEDETVWEEGMVTDIDNEIIEVTLTNGKVISRSKNCVLLRPEVDLSLENKLTNLSPINSATVLHCLRRRFEDKIYYTDAGSTIVAVNPFHEVPALYSLQSILDHHRGREDCAPHIYGIAEASYRSLVGKHGRANQSIIVSGESGSGKTVSAKHLLRYITVVANTDTNRSCDAIGSDIERRILDSNPILEAFGNASTPRNNNSSRFGKYIQLQLLRNGQIQGASIETYLLEKTRVVHQSKAECNFHIFYQLLAGCDGEDVPTSLRSLQSHLQQDFKILPRAERKENDASNFLSTLQALKSIGLSDTMHEAIFEVLTAILYMGNVRFQSVEDEASDIDEDSDLANSTFVELQVSEESLLAASNILAVESQPLEKAFLFRNIQSGSKTRKSVFVKPCTAIEACNRRDCIAMLLYSRLFTWLVDFINSQVKTCNYDNTIGLLDIYGFESFAHNSLEQLCINYANEKLQQHYVQHFLKNMQLEYEAEHVGWSTVAYTDNQPCLDVLEGKHGIFGLLNEEVYLNRKSNPQILGERILDVSNRQVNCVRNPKNFRSCPSFTINHYAEQVNYTVADLVNKNKDNIPIELVNILKTSRKAFISNLFMDYEVESSSGKKKRTVLSKFKSSLDDLMMSLHSSNVHYVRCVKPNVLNKPGVFDNQFVNAQLRASGILATVEISRSGYSSRITYPEFLRRYSPLLQLTSQCAGLKTDSSTPLRSSQENKENEDMYEPMELLLMKQLNLPNTPRKTHTPRKKLRRRAGMSSFDHLMKCSAAIIKTVFGFDYMVNRGFKEQFGRTKIFLKQCQLEKLEGLRSDICSKCAQLIQRVWRKHWRRKQAQRRHMAATCLQIGFRHWHKRRAAREATLLREQAGLLQSAENASTSTSFSAESPSRNLKRRHESDSGCDTVCGDSDAGDLSVLSEIENQQTEMHAIRASQPKWKRMKLDCSGFPRLRNASVGDGIVSKRRLPRMAVRFHTKASVLKNAHLVHRRELQCSLTDCLQETEALD